MMTRRRKKLAGVLWIALLLIAVIGFMGAAKAEKPVSTKTSSTIVVTAQPTPAPVPTATPKPIATPAPTPMPTPMPEPTPEPESVIAEVSIPIFITFAFDPVREDIPLDAETQRLLYKACTETGVQYELALAVIRQETSFRNINGDNGNSIGYMQVQPRWHGDRMERLGVTDLSDPYSNFLVGCDYLAEVIGKDKGLEWALMSYNGGQSYANKLAKAGKVSKYATNVLDYMNKLMEEN